MVMAAVHKPSLNNLGHLEAAGAQDAAGGWVVPVFSFASEMEGNAEQAIPHVPNFNMVRRERWVAGSFSSARGVDW
jgi:hypothetical protein